MSSRITLPINFPIPPEGQLMILDERAYKVLSEREVPAKDGELDGYSPDFFVVQVKLEDVTKTPEGQALLALSARYAAQRAGLA